MAKLNAWGRTEILRLVKEKTSDGIDGISWERWTRVYMSDGNILEKYDVKYLHSFREPQGRLHSLGWKRKGKMENGLTIDEIAEQHTNSGWKMLVR